MLNVSVVGDVVFMPFMVNIVLKYNDSKTYERWRFSLMMARGPLPGCCYGIIPAMTSLEWLPGARRWQKRAKRFELFLLFDVLHALTQNIKLIPLTNRVVSFSYMYMYTNAPQMYRILSWLYNVHVHVHEHTSCDVTISADGWRGVPLPHQANDEGSKVWR